MQKEIGGYFEIETGLGKEYYNYLRFNSSRNSLQFIIRKRKIKKIYLPFYLCLVIEETLLTEDVEIEYYHINNKFMPIIDNYDGESYVYIVNYFGLLSKKQLLKLIDKYKKRIILDNTHAFFMKGFSDIDIIYNCRKYFGVPDGAYLYTDLELDDTYKQASSMDRLIHLFGRYESTATEYYDKYVKADLTLENRDIETMSKITINMLKNVDYINVKKTRKNNFNYLHNKLGNINLLQLNKNLIGDFMYPLLLNNGNYLKKKLIKMKVFIPTLWPGLDKYPLNFFENNILTNLILIPIDQRYSTNDLDYICKKIFEILEDSKDEKN